jgi:CheY-like chemotaxis protein
MDVLPPFDSAAVPAPGRDARNDPRKPGVLVAVGDSAARADLSVYLTAQGFEVWTAGTGLDALGEYFIHADGVDVLVVDAGLRDLPGAAFRRRLRSYFPAVPCVFLIDPARRASQGADLAATGEKVLSSRGPRTELSNWLWAAAVGAWRWPD